MSSRELSDWLTGYIKYTAGSEPPLSYHTWTGVSIIAGALQRRVWLQWGFEKIFPNMYVILVGASGRTRKGVAINIGKDIISELAGICLTSENLTREALIRTMKGAVTNFQTPEGDVRFHCAVTCFSEELSVFLGQNDIKFLASLTDWYDSKDNWTYETKHEGKDHLQGLCFNLLGATAPDWLQSMLPAEAIGGGFTSRVIFVVEERKGKTVSKHVLSPEDIRLRQALIADLNAVNNITGAFTFSQDGEAAYTGWYETYDKELGRGNYPVEDPRFSAYCERRATHLRKLMMVMSASRSDDRQLTKEDFDRANVLLKATELRMHKTFGGLGSAKYSAVTEKVIEYIRNMKVVVRSDLMRKFHRDVDPATLKIIEEVMMQMQVVRIEIIPASNEKVYHWNTDASNKH